MAVDLKEKKPRTTKAQQLAEMEAKLPTIAELAEKVKERFIKEASGLADATNPKELVQAVLADLNTQKQQVVFRLMGLKKDSWEGWRVDKEHGRSLINDLLDEECTEMAKAWVREAIAEVMTDEKKSEVKRQFKAALKKEIDSRIHDSSRAWSHSKEIVEDLQTLSANEMRAELGLPATSPKRSAY